MDGLRYGLPTAAPRPRLTLPLSPPPIVDFLGDSHVANGLTATPPRLRTGPAQFTGQSWYAWASMQARGGFLIGRVDGRAGASTTDLVSQYVDDLINDPSTRHPTHPVRSGYCVVQIGTNGAAASTIGRDKENLRIVVDRLLTANIEPILCTTPPKSSYQTDKFSNFVRLYAQQNGLKCVEFSGDSRIMDNSAGTWVSGLTTDNIHCNDAGAKVVGTILYEHLERWGILTNVVPLPVRDGDGDTLTWPGNALLMDDANADGVPDNWTLTGSGATAGLASLSPPNGLGNELTVTAAAAATTIKSGGRTVLPSSLCAVAVRCSATMAGSSPSVTIRPWEQGSGASYYDFTTTQDIPAGYILAGLVEANGGTAGGAANQVYTSALITPGSGTVVKLSQPAIYDLDAPAGQSVYPL